ncbi:MAG: RNA polymerase sigma-70 factor [Bacteroidales bacterium]|nr:RNA polymerase sigma-70 factor [Bacteroidales bacterium]
MAKHDYNRQDDVFLVEEVKNGNRDAYASLFYRYYPAVTAFCCGILKDRAAAEDIAQEVFMNIWGHRRELWCTNGSIRHLLFKASKNKVIDYLKSRYLRSRDSIEDHNALSSGSTDNLASYNQVHSSIARQVNEMPPKRRDVFLLSRIESLSRKEIAERMDISEATVKKHIELALKQIRESEIFKPDS